MNFYASRLKNDCILIEIFKFFSDYYRRKHSFIATFFCAFFLDLYLVKDISVYLKIFTTSTTQVEVLLAKTEFNWMTRGPWTLAKYALIHSKRRSTRRYYQSIDLEFFAQY